LVNECLKDKNVSLPFLFRWLLSQANFLLLLSLLIYFTLSVNKV